MLNRSSLVAGLLLATLSSAALAQTTTNDGNTAPSAAEPSNTTTEPTAPATEPAVTTEPVAPSNESATQADTNANTNVVTADGNYQKRQGDMRASDLIGKRVYNDANEDIGEIDELVVNADGKVSAVIVGVGGFLGMGERKVAVPFSSLKMQVGTDGSEMRWTTDMTRDHLVNATEWKWTVGQ